jgi:YidC/Oxa1 family membrane protein insertase
MRFFTLVVVCFVVFCGWLVVESGVFETNQPAGQACILLRQTMPDEEPDGQKASAESKDYQQMSAVTTFGAYGGKAEAVLLGSIEPASGFMYELELSTRGAAIRKATFSGFDDRDYKNPQPLVILSPVEQANGSEILSMANKEFLFVQEKLQLSLQNLHFKNLGKEITEDGSQTAQFEAVIKTSAGEPVLKLLKTYKVSPGSYLLDCSIAVENLADIDLKYQFNMAGATGLGREAVRADMRKAIAGFRNSQGQITSVRLDKKKLLKAKTIADRRLAQPGEKFLWVAAASKYFAAILVPEPEKGKDYCDWMTDRIASFYNPDDDDKANSGDETVGLDLKMAPYTLAQSGLTGSTKIYNFQLYVGPKDKSLFDKNALYSELGFVQVIDFPACCCPTSIISPLAFGILAIMKWMYGFIGNYGVVIIILVFMMRLIMHPITKKSQVSMSKMSKLAPKAEEIKKKYANNKTEMNKHIMALYKEQGASPIIGFLPMFVQMPVWIALWSAVYASIALRGAAFLPFWITDLSVPDALVRFSTITIPLLGWKIESLNLLPILMGVAFYLQQKLMPSKASAAANPQVAQQQKMMMIMLPLMFPLMLYKAPSGVNLYIMASTFAGVFEQYFIRKHIRERDQAESKGLVAATSKTGGKVKKKKPKPFYKT